VSGLATIAGGTLPGRIFAGASEAAITANCMHTSQSAGVSMHETVIVAVIMMIGANAAKRRLADEYDAAQERGEIRSAGKPNSSTAEELPGVEHLNLTHKDIHEARQIRDAEEADPGVVRRTLEPVVAAPMGRPREAAHEMPLLPEAKESPEIFRTSVRGDTRDRAAAYVGVSGRTLEKAEAVVAAAEAARLRSSPRSPRPCAPRR